MFWYQRVALSGSDAYAATTDRGASISISVCTSTLMTAAPIRDLELAARPSGSGSGEERLRGASGKIASQPLQDLGPGLGGMSQVDLSVPSAKP
jgi:hypothetical protein